MPLRNIRGRNSFQFLFLFLCHSGTFSLLSTFAFLLKLIFTGLFSWFLLKWQNICLDVVLIHDPLMLAKCKNFKVRWKVLIPVKTEAAPLKYFRKWPEDTTEVSYFIMREA